MMNTTLNKIQAHDPCADGWAKLLAFLGKTEADDEELSLLTILESNGLDDALWALRAVESYDREIRLFACDCAERVMPIYEKECPDDSRVRDCIETARRFAEGGATDGELRAAWDAAADAAWDAARAARAAAWAARDAARAAAWAAARAAAWAARDAARAARAAARDDEREAQEKLFKKMIKEASK